MNIQMGARSVSRDACEEFAEKLTRRFNEMAQSCCTCPDRSQGHGEECPSWAYAKCVRIVELELEDTDAEA